MTVTNEQLLKARAKFQNENEDCSGNINTVWKKLVRKVGDSLLTMTDNEDVQRIFDTVITNETMAKSTRDGYFFSYKRILRFLFDYGYSKFDYRNFERQTNLVYIPRNKNSKMEYSDDSLNEMNSGLKKSLILINQKLEECVQRLEKCSQKKEKCNQEMKECIQEEKRYKQEKKKLDKRRLAILAGLDV